MTDSRTFHLNLLKIAYNNLMQQDAFQGDNADPVALEFLDQFAELVTAFEQHQAHAFDEGQDLLCRLVRAYPQYVHLVARDLFWLFGGECLHFLSDEEIDRFQQLDEALAQAASQPSEFDYLQLRQAFFEPGPSTQH